MVCRVFARGLLISRATKVESVMGMLVSWTKRLLKVFVAGVFGCLFISSLFNTIDFGSYFAVCLYLYSVLVFIRFL